jgi:hypothetical protein
MFKSESNENKLVSDALSYAEKGLYVFPLHTVKDGKCTCGKPDCESPAKHPRTIHGLKQASKDLNFVNSLFSNFTYASANIGVCTGKESNLVVIDVDCAKGASLDDLYKIIAKEELAKTLWAKTGGGYHIYFNYPQTADIRNSTDKLGAKIDIRGEGGYVVAPNSNHISGKHYKFINENEIKPFPLKFFEKLNQNKPDYKNAASADYESTEIYNEGNRNDSLARIAGKLRHAGLSKGELEAALIKINSERCQPPLEVAEVLRIAGSIARYDAGRDEQAFIGSNNLASKNGQGNTANQKVQFNFTTLDSLLAEPEEFHSYVWENTLIFGGFSICSAKPKVGKSTFLRNLAVAITQGDAFLGRETIKGKVLYLCLEEKRSEIAKHFRLMGASGEDILIHTGATPEDALRALKSAIGEFEPVLVIIDPLSRVLRVKDFNDYATMARGLEPLIDLARETGVHIIALHHEGKGEREGGDAILGSQALFGAVDCHIQLRKRNAGRTVSSIQRYGLDLPETIIQLDTQTGNITEQGDLQAFVLREKQTEILDSIADSEQLTEDEIKERIGGSSKGIISKAIRVLLENGKLFRSGNGKKGSPFTYSKNLTNQENLVTDNAKDLIDRELRKNTGISN